jgi:hypothetical protein
MHRADYHAATRHRHAVWTCTATVADQLPAGPTTSQSPIQRLYQWAATNGVSLQPSQSDVVQSCSHASCSHVTVTSRLEAQSAGVRQMTDVSSPVALFEDGDSGERGLAAVQVLQLLYAHHFCHSCSSPASTACRQMPSEALHGSQFGQLGVVLSCSPLQLGSSCWWCRCGWHSQTMRVTLMRRRTGLQRPASQWAPYLQVADDSCESLSDASRSQRAPCCHAAGSSCIRTGLAALQHLRAIAANQMPSLAGTDAARVGAAAEHSRCRGDRVHASGQGAAA